MVSDAHLNAGLVEALVGDSFSAHRRALIGRWQPQLLSGIIGSAVPTHTAAGSPCTDAGGAAKRAASAGAQTCLSGPAHLHGPTQRRRKNSGIAAGNGRRTVSLQVHDKSFFRKSFLSGLAQARATAANCRCLVELLFTVFVEAAPPSTLPVWVVQVGREVQMF